ncbi:MAG TPA: methyltransferase domain-containing protein [Marinagarivorans sp.]
MRLKCPACQQALSVRNDSVGRTLHCTANHSYDTAKDGYVNLLLAQNKRSKNPGDDHAMMQCRQAFLNEGYYHFLADAIADTIAGLGNGSPLEVLDIGCGEGYYGAVLRKRLAHVSLTGFDIAKTGVRLAAKRKAYSHLAVGSAYDIPVMPQSVDVGLSVFSPLDAKDTARALKPGGHLITVGPGPCHLKHLAEQVYDLFKPHQNGFALVDNSPLFECINQTQCHREVTLEGAAIYNLLTMTPYYWSASEEKQQAIKRLARLTTALEFQINTYRLISPS